MLARCCWRVLRALHLYESSLKNSGAVSIFVPIEALSKSTLVPPASHSFSVLSSLHLMVPHRLLQHLLITYAPVPSLTQNFSELILDQRGMQFATMYALSQESVRMKFNSRILPCVLNNRLKCSPRVRVLLCPSVWGYGHGAVSYTHLTLPTIYSV